MTTVSLLLLLVKLGFWQLDRAALKESWQSELILRQSSSPLSFSQLLALPTSEQITGYRLSINASPALDKVFLLDNQVYQGTVGYLALQPMQVGTNKAWILLELGFIPAGFDRSVLPEVTPISSNQHFTGRLYQKQHNPMSSDLMAEPGWPKRIQNLNLSQLSQTLGHPLAPAVLQPEKIFGLVLPHPWKPIPLSAQKHRGYALQWFSMAIALTLLSLFFIYSRRNKTSIKNNKMKNINALGVQHHITAEIPVANPIKTK